MTSCNYNCDQGKNCPAPDACWLPLAEPEQPDDSMNTFIIAMWVAVAIACIVCAVIPALFA